MENAQKPLRLALHGIDSRSTKTLMQFLQGPCKGEAYVVVNAEDGDVDVFDGDSPVSKQLLDGFVGGDAIRPIIVFTLQDLEQEGIFYVTKPVKAHDLLHVFGQSKKAISELLNKNVRSEPLSAKPIVTKQLQKQLVETKKNQLHRSSKHETALRLDEKNFQQYLGLIEDVGISWDKQLIADAKYNPKDYYQGFIQSAVNTAKASNKIMLLESDCCPVMLFPRTQELWLDEGDMELKDFAGIQLNHKTKTTEIDLKPVDPETVSIYRLADKFQNIEAFVWKLACWTSKGRYPQQIDYRLPVYLKNWPNFTRLLVTPHALRIAALLISEPRTMINIAQTLNIKPQYVFVFISAACSVGLAGQATRAVDMLVQPPDLESSTQKGILNRFMTKLRDK